MRSERQPVTVDVLIQIAQAESSEIEGLSHKGKVSLIRRFMDLYDLSIREITGTAGWREEQGTEEDIESRDGFVRLFKQTIIEKQIPIS